MQPANDPGTRRFKVDSFPFERVQSVLESVDGWLETVLISFGGRVSMKYFGGIELGGTKFLCMIAKGPQDILAEELIPTTTPEETLPRAIQFFLTNTKNTPLAAIGIGSFGPLDLDRSSSTYGFITSTPKAGWTNTDIVGPIQDTLQIPVAFDTDVNAASMGEYRWGALKGLDPTLYMTIGTGIGVGGIYRGELMHGMLHPEIGHMLIPHAEEDRAFAGACPFHADCFEGLASGPALKQRWEMQAELLPEDHPAWELEAHYIALSLHNLICMISPYRIVLGGGVMQRKYLFPLIRKKVRDSLNDYIQSLTDVDRIQQLIVPPGLGKRAGILGAIALAINIA